MAAGGDVPHDLATFVVEAALGIEHGFWGCLAEGATFRSLRRRRTEPGVEVIRRHEATLDDAERRVNDAHFGWRRGEPTESPEVAEALDRALAAWRALPEGGELVLDWPPPRTRRLGRGAAAGDRARRR